MQIGSLAGNATEASRGLADISNMAPGVLAPPRLVPPLPQLIKNPFSSSGLSLALPSGLEGQFKFQASADTPRTKEDDHESKSGSDNMEGASGEEDHDQPPRKKRYHRHTPRQIQEMEMLFKECQHPDDKQRQQLSKDLGLSSRQVKFWFQNRRTQMKAQHERAENSMLRGENEKLRAENVTMREALKNASCPNCGSPATLGEMSFDEQQLRIENARLKDELDRVSTLAAKYLGRPIVPLSATGAQQMQRSTLDTYVGGGMQPTGDVTQAPSVLDIVPRPGGLTDSEKPLAIELVMLAMDEFVALAQTDSVWMRNSSGETMNQEEYAAHFHRSNNIVPFGLRTEATRDSGVVMMNGVALVETLMDSSRWFDMFSCIIARAVTLDVISPGVSGNWNGALQQMYSELQVLSPLVPTREINFLRYCKQHAEGFWAVVDVSVDGIRDSNSSSPSAMRCRRRPSGFLIQDMPNGYCKVVVVEHMEYDDRQVSHMYKNLVTSGMAFGARRWLATLQRQCERLATLLATSISSRELGVVPTASGRRSMLKLAQRMTNNFCAGVSASTVHTWTTLSGSGEDDVRVMTRKSIDNPGEPHGIVLSAATSLWLPVSPQRVFDFLHDERLRSEWDILSNGGQVQEMSHIAKGQDPGNSVSLLRVNALNTSQSNMLILQESCTDSSGSLVVYAPVDIPAMNLVMQGGDPAYVALLPSGFAILPDGSGDRTAVDNDTNNHLQQTRSGCLLTVAFQILVSNIPSAKLNLESVATVNSLITCTVQRIKTALRCEDA